MSTRLHATQTSDSINIASDPTVECSFSSLWHSFSKKATDHRARQTGNVPIKMSARENLEVTF